MGGSNSRDDSWRQSSFPREDSWRQSSSIPSTTSSSWDQYQYPPAGYSQDSYPQDSYSYPSRPTVPAYGPTPPQHQYNHGSSSQNRGYGGQTHAPQRKLDRRYSRIADDYNSLEEVRTLMARKFLHLLWLWMIYFCLLMTIQDPIFTSEKG